MLATKLKASESRNSFLEGEIKCLSDRNDHLLKDFESLHETEHSMTCNIRRLEQVVFQDQERFGKKIEGIYTFKYFIHIISIIFNYLFFICIEFHSNNSRNE
jgi:hypothetical protein